jgi:hypothetical protein
MNIDVAAFHQLHRAAIRHRNLHGILVVVIQRPLTKGQANLLEVVDAVDPRMSVMASRHRGQEDRHEHCQNSHDQKELKECKATAFHNQVRLYGILKNLLNDSALAVPSGF